MTSTAVAPKIVGKALYLELVANTAKHDESELRKLLGWQYKGTKQIILFPEYQDDTGRIVGSVVMERLISEHRPRAQWETTYLDRYKVIPADSVAPEGGYSGYVTHNTYSKAEWDSLTAKEKFDSQKASLAIVLKNLLLGTSYTEPDESGNREMFASQGWAVRDDKPISVEITDQDMTELHHDCKTPQAVIRRINKVRGTLDKFPEKLA